jgi:hypothetical protein
MIRDCTLRGRLYIKESDNPIDISEVMTVTLKIYYCAFTPDESQLKSIYTKASNSLAMKFQPDFFYFSSCHC